MKFIEDMKSIDVNHTDNGWIKVTEGSLLPSGLNILAAIPVYTNKGEFLRVDIHNLFIDPETGFLDEEYGWEIEDYEYWMPTPPWPKEYLDNLRGS